MHRSTTARAVLLWALLSAIAATPAWAAVSARLSSDFIDELESVRLTLRATGTRQTETLDLSDLEHDFHVMGTNTSSQYQYINGREQSWVEYQITLQPKRTGTLAIPRISVGSESSNPLQLVVQPIADELRQKIDELVFFENELSAMQTYVQAQIVVTRRLLYSTGVQLYSEIPGAPEIPNAVVLVLGETKSTQTMRNGNRYGMVEQRYAVFPETSGPLTIPGISITASVRIVDGGRVTRKGVRIGTEDVVATVLPVPQEYPGNVPWLPAEAVTIEQQWSPPLDNGVAVGDTLERRVEIRIRGNTGSIAPPLTLDLGPEFRQYPQAPAIQDDTRGDAVVGIRTETISVVPQTPGSLSIPAETIVWWNTLTNQLSTTLLPAAPLRSSGTAIMPLPAAPSAAADAPILEFVDDLANNLDEVTTPRPTAATWRWLIAGLALLAGSIAVYRLRRYLRLPASWRSSRSNSLAARQLRLALAARDPRAVKNALTAFLQAHPELRHDPDAAHLTTLLNGHLYGGEDRWDDTDHEAAVRLAAALQSAASARRTVEVDLPPLYPVPGINL